MNISEYIKKEVPEQFDFTSLTDFLNYIKSQGYLVDFSDEKNMKHWINEFNEYVAKRK
jgi:lysine/ornithine N-monooxygenase